MNLEFELKYFFPEPGHVANFGSNCVYYLLVTNGHLLLGHVQGLRRGHDTAGGGHGTPGVTMACIRESGRAFATQSIDIQRVGPSAADVTRSEKMKQPREFKAGLTLTKAPMRAN